MRIILIIGALLLGLVGLFMSVCGGGFFIRMAYDSVSSLVLSGRWQDWPAALILLAIPAACATVGGLLCWISAKYLRNRMRDHDRDNP
jgi:hypothetical protein